LRNKLFIKIYIEPRTIEKSYIKPRHSFFIVYGKIEVLSLSSLLSKIYSISLCNFNVVDRTFSKTK